MEKEMLFGRELVMTTNLQSNIFNNAPFLGETHSISVDAWLPKNLTLGKTYYFLNANGNLVAFKIHAYSFIKQGLKTILCGLIQTPNDTSWRYDVFKCMIFASVENYYKYLESGKGVINIEQERLKCGSWHNSFGVDKTYYWNKCDKRPRLTNTHMWRILITDTHICLGVDYKHSQYGKSEQGFSSAEECIKANIGGMTIMDFEEPKITIDIHIEPQRPKVRVVKFIEE